MALLVWTLWWCSVVELAWPSMMELDRMALIAVLPQGGSEIWCSPAMVMLPYEQLVRSDGDAPLWIQCGTV